MNLLERKKRLHRWLQALLAMSFSFLLVVSLTGAPTLADTYQSPAFDRGKTLMLGGDWDKAIVAFGEALGLDSEDARAYQMRGQCFFNLNKIQQAMDDFTHVIEISPNNSRALLWRGTMHAKLNQDEAAINDYQDAIKSDSKLARDFQRAVPKKQRRQSKQPSADQQASNGIPVIVKFGTSSNRQRGDDSHAIALYSKAMQAIYPTGYSAKKIVASNQQSVGTGANVAQDQKTADLAEVSKENAKDLAEQYSEAIRQEPRNAANYYHRGKAYQRLNNLDRALADFTRAINLSPQNGEFYVARASVHMLLHQQVLADADLRNARSADPTLPKKITLDLIH